MQKINFQNLPNTTTPINATNLNAIQTNAETAINGVASDVSSVASDLSGLSSDVSGLSSDLSNVNSQLSSLTNKLGDLSTQYSSWSNSITFELEVGHLVLVIDANYGLLQLWNPADRLNVAAIYGDINNYNITRANDGKTITITKNGNSSWGIIIV